MSDDAATIRKLQETIRQREATIFRLNGLIVARDATIAQLTAELARLEQECRAGLRELDATELGF